MNSRLTPPSGFIPLNYLWLWVGPNRQKVGTWMTGRVRRLVGYGAWVDVGSDVDGFLHVNAIKVRREASSRTRETDV